MKTYDFDPTKPWTENKGMALCTKCGEVKEGHVVKQQHPETLYSNIVKWEGWTLPFYQPTKNGRHDKRIVCAECIALMDEIDLEASEIADGIDKYLEKVYA